MDIHDIIAAITAANLLTALALWGLFQFSKVKEVHEASWLAIGAVLLPLAYVLVTLTVTQPPPFLAALAAR